MASSNLLASTSHLPKNFCSTQLSVTTGVAVYTAPSPGWGIVRSGTICNVGAAAVATLSSALSTGSPITALPVTATTFALPSGQVVLVGSAGNTQAFVLSSAAAAGATSLAVTSQTPNFAYPIGSSVGGVAVPVTVAVVPSGGSFDGTHRVLSAFALAAGDTLDLRGYLTGAHLGAGDAVYVQAATANVIDVVITGTEGT